jgi:signal transduction histidine kinase
MQSNPASTWASWRNDRLLHVAFLVFVISALPYFLPFLDGDQRWTYGTFYSEILLIVLTLAALEARRRRGESRRERRFWGLLSAALASWLSSWVLYFFVSLDVQLWAVELTADLLNLLYYLFLFLAATSHPHLAGRSSRPATAHRTETIGTIVFVFGFLVYFVLLPSRLTPEAYLGYVPSLLMYVVLDFLLAIGFLHLARHAEGGRWRNIYRSMGLGVSFWLVLDSIECLQYLNVFPWVDAGTPFDILWFFPYLPLIAATRVAAAPEGQASASRAGAAPPALLGSDSSRALLVVYTTIFPVLHFGLYATGLGEPASRQAREGCVFLLVILLGVLAVNAHQRLERDRRRAESETRRQGERLRALSRRLASAQEDERRQIARELHDQIGQELTGLQLSLAALRHRDDGKTQAGIAAVEVQFTALMKRVRELSLMLRPSMLDDHGLEAALRWLSEHFGSQTGLRVHFEGLAAADGMAPETRVAAYRIVQEALTNAARHSGAQEATVRLRADETAYRIDIIDQGVGFELESIEVGLSCGLDGMRERAELVGGSVTFLSGATAGTCVEVILPLA